MQISDRGVGRVTTPTNAPKGTTALHLLSPLTVLHPSTLATSTSAPADLTPSPSHSARMFLGSGSALREALSQRATLSNVYSPPLTGVRRRKEHLLRPSRLLRTRGDSPSRACQLASRLSTCHRRLVSEVGVVHIICSKIADRFVQVSWREMVAFLSKLPTLSATLPLTE